MCGIAGYVSRARADSALLRAMGDRLAHRGPDDSGEWTDGAVGLAHRRLAIVDLSPGGHQPMLSADGRWAISYNGEIYNQRALRRDLAPEGGWRGYSDTETLVESIAAWGLDDALARARGMFAFAAYDRRDRRLHLVRDQFGEKPLYYGWAGGDFLFASELKAARIHPDFDDTIDRDALAAFAALSVVPAPTSIYRAMRKLLPGHLLTIDVERLEAREGAVTTRRYWSYADVVTDGAARPFGSEDEALTSIDGALRGAIADQSVADVPVGAFLSGGIDSSLVVALYQAVSGTKVKTYTIGFDEAGYDESDDAAAIAAHLGTDHHEHRVGPAEAMDVLPLLPAIYDEPFADSSQIPTYLVSRFARSDVTVAITGDGGDELFAGYNRHRLAPTMWRSASCVPLMARRVAGGLAGALPRSAWTMLGRAAGGRDDLGDKACKAVRIASHARTLDDVYRAFVDEWSDGGTPVVGGQDGPWWGSDLPPGTDPLTRLTHADATGYLPDDVLAKVDRASMAVSLETRVPFLDPRVAGVAARCPPGMKVRAGRGKHIVRELLYRHVPRALVDRPKAGFAVPVGQWLRGPLRDWAEALLDEKRLVAEGYFDAARVRRRWQDHLSGRQDSTVALWSVLTFEAWLDVQRNGG